MSLEYISKTYNVPAMKGQRVRYQPEGVGRESWEGAITGAEGQYLLIKRDGDKKVYPAPFHPTWGITYLEQQP